MPHRALPVTIASDEAIEMKDIRVVPTIGIEKTEIVQGENLMLYGQGLAGSEIILSFKGLKDFFVKLYAGQDGAYQYALDTTSVASGMYEVSARSSVGNTNGIFGGAVSVFVGKKFAPPVAVGPSSDLNSDGRVSVADFSVLAFWYKKTGFPARIDLNSDGAITIVDFSIMAYQWNG